MNLEGLKVKFNTEDVLACGRFVLVGRALCVPSESVAGDLSVIKVLSTISEVQNMTEEDCEKLELSYRRRSNIGINRDRKGTICAKAKRGVRARNCK